MSGLKIQFVDNSANQYDSSAFEIAGVVSHLRGKLWLGDRESASFLQLRHRKITHVINCEKDIHGISKEEGITYLNIDPESDDGKCFETATEFIDKHCKEGGKNVLVHCQTGNGRSAGVLLYYFMTRLPGTLAHSHRTLKKINSQIAPRSDLVKLLLVEERKLNRGLETVMLGEKRQLIYTDGGEWGADKIASSSGSQGGKKKGGGYSGWIGLAVVVVFFAILYGGLTVLTAPKQTLPPASGRRTTPKTSEGDKVKPTTARSEKRKSDFKPRGSRR